MVVKLRLGLIRKFIFPSEFLFAVKTAVLLLKPGTRELLSDVTRSGVLAFGTFGRKVVKNNGRKI